MTGSRDLPPNIPPNREARVRRSRASAGNVMCGRHREWRDPVVLKEITEVRGAVPGRKTAGNIEVRGAGPRPRYS